MQYENWMAAITGLSAKKKRKLQQICGGSEGVYNIEESQIKRMEW